jgi:hypothetical protein
MEGYVVESDLHGIAGATVELQGDASAPNLRGVKMTATTDTEGKYAINDIPHGPYTLRVTAPGYRPYEIPIYMLSDTQTKLHVRLTKTANQQAARERRPPLASATHN